MRIFLAFVLAIVAYGILVSGDPTPPPFPATFTVIVEVTVPNHERPILYRMYYDSLTNRTRLDSWGISNETDRIRDPATRPPPLYFFVFLYNEQKLLSYLPAPGMRCTASDLTEAFPAPGPDLSACTYKGQASVGGIMCNMWAGIDPDFGGDFVYAASEIANLPVQVATIMNGTRVYSEFNLTQPDEQFFNPPVPCAVMRDTDSDDDARTEHTDAPYQQQQHDALAFMRQMFDVVASEAAHAVGDAVALAQALQEQQARAADSVAQLLHSVLRSWFNELGL